MQAGRDEVAGVATVDDVHTAGGEDASDVLGELDGQHVAFTHWKGDETQSTGVTQYCSETSGAALESFMAEYPYTDAPEAGAI